jgi:hypothetical protein
MKPKEKQVLETFKHMLEQRVHLSTFALFGSRARGGAGRYSDMDVLVEVDQLDTPTAGDVQSDFRKGPPVCPPCRQACCEEYEDQLAALQTESFWFPLPCKNEYV